MNSFFSFDGLFYKWGTAVADVLILSLLWTICSLPMVTVGASTTALFYVFGKIVRGEEPYIFRTFFKSFKDNFKQSTILTLILGILWFSVYFYFQLLKHGNAKIWVQAIAVLYIVQVVIVTMYLFPVLSRFDMSIKNLLLASFVFGNKHLLTTILSGILFAAAIFLIINPTPISIFSFGIYALITSFLFQRIFTRHIAMMKEIEDQDNK